MKAEYVLIVTPQVMKAESSLLHLCSTQPLYIFFLKVKILLMSI